LIKGALEIFLSRSFRSSSSSMFDKTPQEIRKPAEDIGRIYVLITRFVYFISESTSGWNQCLSYCQEI